LLGLGRRGKQGGEGAGSALQIDADLSGAVISGQVAIGEHIVQIHAEHGAFVNYQPAAERPAPRARGIPVRCLPRPFDGLIGRDELLADVHAALAKGGPAELVGESGIGKTAVLRNVSHHLAELQPHGVVYTGARCLPVADVLQFLFESFYDCGTEVMVATVAELARYLGDRQALIVIDDAELAREELQHVMDVVHSSSFLCAASERHVWGEGRSFAVGGLDDGAARTLLEHELDRSLGPDEAGFVISWCQSLGGSPLRILQAADLLRDGVVTVEAVSAGSVELGPAALDRLLAGQISETSRSVIAPLAAVREAPVPTEAIAAATEVGDTAERLAHLEGAHIVESHSPRYTLAGNPSPALISTPGRDDSSALIDTARNALIGVLAGRKGKPPRQSAEAEVLLALVRDSERRGSIEDTLTLAHAADGPLGLGARWGAWKITLEAALRAASAAGSQGEEAWALHQLGSRALGVGDRVAAVSQLTRALELRQELGDHAGAAVTRHNLDLLSGPPPPERPPPRPRPRLPLLAGAIILALAAGAAIAIAASSGPGPKPTQIASVTTHVKTKTHTRTKPSTTTRSTTTRSTTTGSITTHTTPPPPAAALKVSPAQLPIPVRERSGTVFGGTQFTATNTSSSTVSIKSVATDDLTYMASFDGCQASLAHGQQCDGSVTLQATTPSGSPTELMFILNGASTVTVPITLCLVSSEFSSAVIAEPSTTTTATGTTTTRTTTGTTDTATTSTSTTTTGTTTTGTGTTTTSTTTTQPPPAIPPCPAGSTSSNTP
jgi:hypothetical protein